MDGTQQVVIIGGGLAGAKTAEALRDHGFTGTVTLIAAEAHLPYERPPMSKSFLIGASPFDDALVHTAEWYREKEIDLRTGTRAIALDTGRHRVGLEDGDEVAYDKLVLATGSTPRRLPVPGAEASGVHYLRTREDSDAIRSTFGPGRRLVVIGGGWIGLEVAAAARGAGTEVCVVEAADLPLSAALGPELAVVFADLHRANGVDLRLSTRLNAVLTDGGRAVGVELDGGERIDADGIVVGIGAVPQTGLAEAAGLAVDDGVLVDASLRTSDPDVYAVGDIANHDHPALGRRMRVEHWAAALNQPSVAAAALLGGAERYTELPYFYSDQYDLGMEYIGHSPEGSYDRIVVRGALAAQKFVAFWLDRDNRIKAAMNVNVWDVVDQIKHLIGDGRPIDPERLADPGVPYAEL
ncbi:NAD(P)/FAD-dependent oxidoreductase [Glycomyces arizonensis]|uniref:NAD(P)/FAD-dependent oxidoreductase n=1 Tax=Glycomyces arizonensis TaxID=256035 RepID=UPI00041344D6|nr:FAD-dependent oxidoreductase [Glycomyces arizonensis]